jgi:acyl-CoA thioesterase-1
VRSSSLRRLVSLGVAAVVLLAVGAGAVGVRRHIQCEPVRANAAAAPDHGRPGAGHALVIVGDSYSTGFDLSDPRESWAYETAANLGLKNTIAAYPGTGFGVSGHCGGDVFADRLGAVTASTKLVLVQGGLNDAIFDTSSTDLRSEGSAVVRSIRASAPKTRIIIVGPAQPRAVQKDAVDRVAAALQETARTSGVEFLDLRSISFRSPDGTHPDDAGQQRIAAAVEDAARK